MQRTDSLEETLMLGKIEGGRRRGRQRMRRLDGITSPTQWMWIWVNSTSWWWTGRLGMLQSMGSQRVGHDWATELNWLMINKGLPWWLSSKEATYNAGDTGSIPGLGRSPGEGNGNPLQYSCLANPMYRGVWRAKVYGVIRVGLDLATKPPPWLTETWFPQQSKS